VYQFPAGEFAADGEVSDTILRPRFVPPVRVSADSSAEKSRPDLPIFGFATGQLAAVRAVRPLVSRLSAA